MDDNCHENDMGQESRAAVPSKMRSIIASVVVGGETLAPMTILVYERPASLGLYFPMSEPFIEPFVDNGLLGIDWPAFSSVGR